MKKKILSLILVLMLLPITSLFGACGKDDGYNLNNLQTDFYDIANKNNNVVVSNGNLEFDYSNHDGVEQIVNTTSPYTTLADYNFVFKNLMSFVGSYIDECSNNDVTKNSALKNSIKNNLDKFTLAISDVNECFNLFAEAVYDDQNSQDSLIRYENLLHVYHTMYVAAGKFSNSLSNLYYNHILNGGNPDVYGVRIENFNSGLVVTKFESRIKYQLSNLSQNFVEMYVSGDLAKEIANGADFDLTKYNYQSNVEALNQPIASVQAAIEKANVNKEEFYTLSVQAQNLQSTLNNDCSKFIVACDDVD